LSRGEEARVGDGGAEDVAGEIVEDGLLALAPGGTVDDPVLKPGGAGWGEIRPFGGEESLELAADELG